jgi:septal ring factor EnvC (AmiA/AmiB activator)
VEGLLAKVTLAIAFVFFLGASIAQGQTDNPQTARQESEAKQKLDQVRGEIRRISDETRAIDAKKNTATKDLRDQELKISAAAKALRETDQKLAAQQGRLDQLVAQQTALEDKLKEQREALAALLRSAYAMGRGEELKMLLAQERTDTLARMLGYYRYFERARVGEIDALLKDLEELATVQKAVDDETAELRHTRAAQADETRQLEAERAERSRLLAELDVALKNQQVRLAALGKDEKALLDLLAKLRDIFADIPGQIVGAEPFSQLRGRLSWPVRGKAVGLTGGDEGEHENHGVLIAAASGSEVRAVSHGRVVFADWLRGFGLLMILDHGDGYLSLYGYNEALLKEVGDWVDANEVIATSGASGGRKTPGVYFELRYQGKALDSKGWLRPSH